MGDDLLDDALAVRLGEQRHARRPHHHALGNQRHGGQQRTHVAEHAADNRQAEEARIRAERAVAQAGKALRLFAFEAEVSNDVKQHLRRQRQQQHKAAGGQQLARHFHLERGDDVARQNEVDQDIGQGTASLAGDRSDFGQHKAHAHEQQHLQLQHDHGVKGRRLHTHPPGFF